MSTVLGKVPTIPIGPRLSITLTLLYGRIDISKHTFALIVNEIMMMQVCLEVCSGVTGSEFTNYPQLYHEVTAFFAITLTNSDPHFLHENPS